MTQATEIRSAGGALVTKPRKSQGRIGPWELVEQIAEGMWSEVYRAAPMSAGSAAYVLKVLRPEWQDDARALGRLRREAMACQAVAHPHVVPVLAASLREPPYFIVMPWLEGQTLAARLAGRRPLDIPFALWIARQMAEALEALDAAGWIHGDIKPENILLSPEGHATLIDMGFARYRDELHRPADLDLRGTGKYLAPEAATSTLRIDIRSDIYSLGAVLFEMLAGRVPFDGQTLAECIDLHREARPPRLRSLAPHVPREAAALVHCMLAKDPLRRPQSPPELVDQLARLEIETFALRAAA
jgi:serine/threonine-protein kinase